MVKKFISEQLDTLDTPLLTSKLGFLQKVFKGGKIRVFLINEDLSFKEYYRKFPKSYLITIKKKSYLFLSNCLINGKFPTICYYFGNPYPLKFEYEVSQLTALDLRTESQQKELSKEATSILINTQIDAETLNLAFSTRVMGSIYGTSSFTAKHLIIILVVVAVLVLIFLQVFGVVDVMGMISGGAKK